MTRFSDFAAIRQKLVVGMVVLTNLICISVAPLRVYADPLTSMSDTLSSTVVDQTGVTHTIDFVAASTVPLEQINMQFSTANGTGGKPAGLGLSSTTLGTVSGIGSGWSLDNSSASSGLLIVKNTSAIPVSSGTAISIAIQNVTNSSLGDCQPSSHTLVDSCWIDITTFSDLGMTAYDSGTTRYTVIEYPSLNLTISGVSGGATHNGLTSSHTSDDTALNFQSLGAGNVVYLTQKLRITTNAPNGYTIYAQLENPIAGQVYSGQFSPFGATDATWTTPQSWTEPTGVISNSNSGWIAANTSDTNVSGWSSGSGKLGPLSTSKKPIAYSDGPDPSGRDIYITYAMGVNSLQASDVYKGNIIYSIEPIY